MRFLLLALPALLVACTGASPDTAAGECVDHDGNVRTADESWTAEDGCNTCTCSEGGGEACTEIACG
ncbi:MAG: hypothetical protein Q8P18_05910 [Pseudomonadota bacterium]|nr:hypothetical protein [Pseudomonadota bacterium]